MRDTKAVHLLSSVLLLININQKKSFPEHGAPAIAGASGAWRHLRVEV